MQIGPINISWARPKPAAETKPKIARYSDIIPVRRFDIDNEVESERLLSLKYAADEISRRNIRGAVAEAGVMYGYFARFIGAAFPDRPLHLFDTFSGFDREELDHDRNQGLLTGRYSYDLFAKNSIETIKQAVPQAIYHVGLFGATCRTLSPDIAFAFVSIDMDLYTPTTEALHFFYPRMSKGGYLFVHDYNHPEDFRGARKAVHDFDAAHGLRMVPLPDFSGTMVIVA